MTVLNNARALYLGDIPAEAAYAGELRVWPAAYEDQVLADEPAAWYRLAEDGEAAVLVSSPALDSSGNNRHASYGTTVTMPGLIGPARSAYAGGSSTGSRVMLPAGLVIPATAAFSFEYWRRISTLQRSPNPVIQLGAATASNDCRLYDVATDAAGAPPPWAIRFDFGSSAARLTWTGGGDGLGTYRFADGIQWWHVVVTVAAGPAGTARQRILYVNGEQVATSSPATAPVADMAGGFLGYTWGAFTEVAIYDRVLPAGRVLAHYQAMR